MLLPFIRGEFGGVVRVGVSSAAQLGGLLFPLLDLLHVSAAALVVLKQVQHASSTVQDTGFSEKGINTENGVRNDNT